LQAHNLERCALPWENRRALGDGGLIAARIIGARIGGLHATLHAPTQFAHSQAE
jgi:hypothetical protein